MHRIAVVLLMLSAFQTTNSNLLARQAPWPPSASLPQIALWPDLPARTHARPHEVVATVLDAKGNPKLVGGKPWIYVDSVTQPTVTIYSPKQYNTGVAVLVFPGGGYGVLAIDLEGTEACDWLTSRGITCALLKYRVPCAVVGPYRECPSALEDAQRAMGLLRSRAGRWHIDPHKIGVLGFSAGGHMVAALSTHFQKRAYALVDAADKESCRPDFAVALYPGHLAIRENDFVLNSHIHVTHTTPPTFIVQAQNDPVDPVQNSLVYYGALEKAGVPAELHVYATGGHAFGLRPTTSPITHWPQLMQAWLAELHILDVARN